jgi:hypothetical protein
VIDLDQVVDYVAEVHKMNIVPVDEVDVKTHIHDRKTE